MKAMRYLNSILTVLTLLLALNLWTAWTAGPGLAAPAYAQGGIPDAGAQRLQIVDQLKLLNQKVDQLNNLMTSGKVRVQATVTNAPAEDQQQAQGRRR